MRGHSPGICRVWLMVLGFVLLDGAIADANVVLTSGQIEYNNFLAFDPQASFIFKSGEGPVVATGHTTADGGPDGPLTFGNDFFPGDSLHVFLFHFTLWPVSMTSHPTEGTVSSQGTVHPVFYEGTIDIEGGNFLFSFAPSTVDFMATVTLPISYNINLAGYDNTGWSNINEFPRPALPVAEFHLHGMGVAKFDYFFHYLPDTPGGGIYHVDSVEYAFPAATPEPATFFIWSLLGGMGLGYRCWRMWILVRRDG